MGTHLVSTAVRQEWRNQPEGRHGFCKPKAGSARTVVEISKIGSPNIACATHVPNTAPTTWQAT